MTSKNGALSFTANRWSTVDVFFFFFEGEGPSDTVPGTPGTTGTVCSTRTGRSERDQGSIAREELRTQKGYEASSFVRFGPLSEMRELEIRNHHHRRGVAVRGCGGVCREPSSNKCTGLYRTGTVQYLCCTVPYCTYQVHCWRRACVVGGKRIDRSRPPPSSPQTLVRPSKARTRPSDNKTDLFRRLRVAFGFFVDEVLWYLLVD